MKISIIALIWLSLISLIENSSQAQVVLEPLHQIEVRDGAAEIPLPWIGGLNSAQYGKADLDNDGAEELVIYDRSGNIFRVFKNAENQWEPAFHLAEYLPDIPAGWVLFVDYNRDGRKDIFSNGDRGIVVFKNITSQGSQALWEKVADPLYTTGFTGKINLIANMADVPAITDIDGDGDVDILVYNFAVGGYIRYNRNLSMDMYGHTDSLEYEIKSRTWGEFEECTCNEFAFNGQTCTDLAGGRVMHPGGKSLLAIDYDGDGDSDLLAGHEQCVELYYYENMGDKDSAFMTGFSAHFPDAVNPANFHIFPTAFYEDLDFDGIKDLVVAPGFEENFEFKIDFAQSNKLYRNSGDDQLPDFRYVQDDFMQSLSLDFGEYSVPMFVDMDADGLSDLLVAANGYWNGEFFSGYITTFRNTGSAGNPGFLLAEEDYLDLSLLKLVNPVINLADMDGNQSQDLIYWAVNKTTFKPECRFIPNSAAAGNPVNFNMSAMQSITIPGSAEVGDSPCFFDVNGDGFADLLLAKKNGALEYYQNSGSNQFALIDASYLGIDRDFNLERLNLVASVADVDGNQAPDLLVTDSRGVGRVYFDFQTQPGGEAHSVEFVSNDPENNQQYPIRFDSKTWLSGADLFGLNTSSLIAGGTRGGLQFYKNPAIGSGSSNPDIVISIYPNPVMSSGGLTIRADRDLTGNLITLLGQHVLAPFKIDKYQDTLLETRALANGMYILHVQDAFGHSTSRLFMVAQ